MIRLLLTLLFIVPPIAAAQADLKDRPLSVLRVEGALGQEVVDHRAGVTGAVYALRAPDGVSSAQIALDAEARPLLARLVRSAAAPNATHDLTEAVIAVARVFGVPDTVLEEALTVEAIQLLTNKHAGDRSRPLPEGATLAFLSEQDVLVVDLPLDAPSSRRLGPDAVETLIADGTLVVQYEDRAVFRYHAPDRRFAEGVDVGATETTGSWRVEDSGAYCLERAPVAGFTCHAIHGSGDRFHAVPLTPDGDPVVAGLVEIVSLPGNPGAHRVARRADSTPPRVTRMLTRDRSEDRRLPDGGRARLHMAADGTYRGVSGDGDPVAGTWSVLADGRRCLLDAATDAFECAFLSETDGGTYRLFDADGTLVGEALLSDGNPFGF
jgi:hypothetical protein